MLTQTFDGRPWQIAAKKDAGQDAQAALPPL
jgi:hypothetical protein